MSDIAIKIEGLSKQYRLGQVGTGTVSHDLNRWWHKVRGKEDPYLKIGETNDRSTKGESEYVWALKDINFEVKKGEVLGIIGKNGAGKSTLLKLLSKVTAPTEGFIKANGRIASLLEVGTGFHPEMTGRENIYMNGTIMGMSKPEITSKLDEIVEFAGIERYLDTPAKRYSSGMTVRLGFAIAAHLEPEILIVDEVLAVGDAEFQKKAIGKMKEVSEGQGRTVLFVSHNLASVKSLCNSGLVLKNGTTAFAGPVEDSINFYLNNVNKSQSSKFINSSPKVNSDIIECGVTDAENNITSNFSFDKEIHIYIKFKISPFHLHSAVLGVEVKDQKERVIFSTQAKVNDYFNIEGEHVFDVALPVKTLVPNSYSITIGYHIPNVELFGVYNDILNFSIEETGTEYSVYSNKDYGCVFLDVNWQVKI